MTLFKFQPLEITQSNRAGIRSDARLPPRRLGRGLGTAVRRPPPKPSTTSLPRARLPYLTLSGLLLCIAAVGGCSGEDKPPAKPPENSNRTTATPPAKTVAADPTPAPPLLPESHTWTREQAAERLADDNAALSAAVRLLELSDWKFEDPEAAWTHERVAAMRVMPIAEDKFVFGRSDPANEHLLIDAVFIHSDGTTESLPGETSSAMRVYASPDRDLFPSLLLSGRQVRLISDLSNEALLVESPESVAFDLRVRDELANIVLVFERDGVRSDVARYRWDPYELTFIGPASDKLPDPPGGKFQLDLRRSTALTPMGGEIPPPPENQTPPPEKDGPIY